MIGRMNVACAVVDTINAGIKAGSQVVDFMVAPNNISAPQRRCARSRTSRNDTKAIRSFLLKSPGHPQPMGCSLKSLLPNCDLWEFRQMELTCVTTVHFRRVCHDSL